MKIKIFMSIAFISFVFFSCSDVSNPTSISKNNGSESNQSLLKSGYSESDQINWNYNSGDYESELDFTFEGYDYHFTYKAEYGVGSTYKLYVNNSYVDEMYFETYEHYPPFAEQWTDWNDFNYNGTPMSYRLKLVDAIFEGMGQFSVLSTPLRAQVKVFSYFDPDTPTGFSVSPTMHNNLSQTVSVSWNPSYDTDVTGYEIYRNKYYLVNGVLKNTGFKLAKTITSRTVSTWLDNPIWGTRPHAGIGYYYKIRAVDGTHNLKSSFSNIKESYLEDYDDILP